MGGTALLHLLDENRVHWLQTIPLSPWQPESERESEHTCRMAIGHTVRKSSSSGVITRPNCIGRI